MGELLDQRLQSQLALFGQQLLSAMTEPPASSQMSDIPLGATLGSSRQPLLTLLEPLPRALVPLTPMMIPPLTTTTPVDLLAAIPLPPLPMVLLVHAVATPWREWPTP